LNKLGLSQENGIQAWKDVLMAPRDVVRRQRYEVSKNMLDEFAQMAFVAPLDALDIAVPERTFYATSGSPPPPAGA